MTHFKYVKVHRKNIVNLINTLDYYTWAESSNRSSIENCNTIPCVHLLVFFFFYEQALLLKKKINK
jgi:hypothetical protein